MSRCNPATDNWSVYIHTVPKEITGYDYDKYYVGITSRNPNIRWRKGGKGYDSQPFANAIKKYGWDNMKHQIVARYLSEEEALDMERLLIFLYQSKVGQKGYNCTDGGEGAVGRIASEEEKETRAQEMTERWANPQFHEKMKSIAVRGENHHSAVKVVLLNTKEVFGTLKEASKKLHLYAPQIRVSCLRKTICDSKIDDKGYVYCFAYYDDYIKMTDEQIINRLKSDTANRNRKIITDSIVCLNTKEIFSSFKEALEKYPNASRSGIGMCCNAKFPTKSSGHLPNGDRLVWVYYSEYQYMTTEEQVTRLQNGIRAPKNVVRIKPELVIDVYTKEIYDSVVTCSEKNNIPTTSLRRILKGNISSRTKYEKDRYMFYKDYLKLEENGNVNDFD